MILPRLSLFALAATLVSVSWGRTDDALPADKPIGEVVDHYVDAKLKEKGITPAPQVDDATLIRRLSLDLIGRIPTPAETKAYVESTDADKRAKLIERLLASSGFVRHQAAEFDAMMMPGVRANMRDYLTRAFAENRPWDQIFREVLLPNESDPKLKGSGEFVRQRITDIDRLTNDVSTTFFGVNISCAQCHDHPKVRDWKQDHFFGMKAFFSRSFDNGGFIGEREFTAVKFRTTEGQDRVAKLMFLTGKSVEDPRGKELSAEEQKKERERFETAKKNKTPPPAPSFSARAQLVELALQPENRDYFARSIVNRVWQRLHGQGLVMPLDQMHSKNPPSHPELLRWLARDTIEHNYDLRRLIGGLVQSQAYSRSSRWDSGDAPDASLFAVASVRPLAPMQLAASLRIATSNPASFPAKADDLEKHMERLEASARSLTAGIEQPRENHQIGVSEALLFSNSERVQKELLADGGDRLIGRLKELKDDGERIDLAVRSVLSRPPTEDEIKLLGAYLAKRQDRPVDACRQIVWALLTGSEFRFNY